MSAVVEQPPLLPAPEPRTGSLLRAELLRFRSRRFIQVVLVLAVLGWLAAVLIALPNYGEPSASDRAAAEAEIARIVDESNLGRESCLADPSIPGDLSPEEACGPPITADDFRVEDFIGIGPFSFAGNAQTGATAFAAAAAVVAFLIGATWIGAEWSSRSIVAQLFWEPRRSRVMAAKLAVLAGATALLGAAAQAGWLAMAGILSVTAGDGQPLPEGLWGDLLATQGRAVLLAVLVGLIGFGLTSLVRNTGAALGIGFVYFAVVETALAALRPHWQPWLLTSNAAGLVGDGGQTLYIWDQTAQATGEPVQYVLGNLQAGVFLGVVTAVIVAAGMWLFARRDLH